MRRQSCVTVSCAALFVAFWASCDGLIDNRGSGAGADGGSGRDRATPGDDRPGSGPGPDGSSTGPDGRGPGPDGSLPGPDGGVAGPDGSLPGPDGGVPVDVPPGNDAAGPPPDGPPPPPPPPPPPFPDNLPPAGNPDGNATVPAEAQAENISSPATVVGDGQPQSCTSQAVVDAVAQGGVITFNCGTDPLTITMAATAKVFNNRPDIVLDGGGKITLSGGGQRRILYMNTCDEAQVFTSPMCQNQDNPHLAVQNITLVDGNSTGETFNGGGGGAIFVRGGRVKIVNSRFFRNTTDSTGPDVGGAAVRVLSQFQNRPVFVVNSTFGGEDGLGNVGSNGGGLSGIGVSFTVINSLFSYNHAIGDGANPARNGTPGGGSGGAIYNDGNTFTLTLLSTRIEHNTANEGGGAIFFVSNDRSGTLVITDSVLSDNPSDGFETQGFPGIFVLAAGNPQVTNSTIE